MEDEVRIDRVNDLVLAGYSHLQPDDVDSLAGDYEKTTTRMFEVIHVYKNASILMDVHDDIEFSPVKFASHLVPLLRREDVFVGTLGYRDGQWDVLHMNPLYDRWDRRDLDS